MRFGACTTIESINAIESAGFDYIELGVVGDLNPEISKEHAFGSAAAALSKSRLKAESFNGFLPGDLRVIGPDLDISRQQKYLEEAFSRVALLDGKIVVFGSAGARRIPDGYSPIAARQDMLDFLQRAGDCAARYEVTIAIEPLNLRESNYINSVQQAMDLVRELAHPAIRVLSDLYHVDIEHQSYAETEAADKYLCHVHVAGVQDRRAPIREDIEFLIPYFRVLKEMGYEGRISVEGHWTDITAQAAEAREVLDRAWSLA